MTYANTITLNAAGTVAEDPLTDAAFVIRWTVNEDGSLNVEHGKTDIPETFLIEAFCPFSKMAEHAPALYAMYATPDRLTADGQYFVIAKECPRAEIRKTVEKVQEQVHRWYVESFDVDNGIVTLTYTAKTGYTSERRNAS